jgi:DUF1365 family protein
VYQVYLDVDEIDQVKGVSRLCGTSRWSPLRFIRKDFHGENSLSVKEAVYKTVAEQTGKALSGPVGVLANWRCFGFNFNPLTTYFCFDQSGSRVEAVLAEVTNTPWMERHAYVLTADDDGSVSAFFEKKFTVSPFNPVNMHYDWYCSQIGEDVSIRIKNYFENEKIFHASMGLQRLEFSKKNIHRLLLHFPVMSLQVVLAIYWQALRLFLKKVPFLGKDKLWKKNDSDNKVVYESDSHSS